VTNGRTPFHLRHHVLYALNICVLAFDDDAKQGVFRAHHGEEALEFRHLHIAALDLGDDSIDLLQVEPGRQLHDGQDQVAVPLRQVVDGRH
jgi:hypothetical protein